MAGVVTATGVTAIAIAVTATIITGASTAGPATGGAAASVSVVATIIGTIGAVDTIGVGSATAVTTCTWAIMAATTATITDRGGKRRTGEPVTGHLWPVFLALILGLNRWRRKWRNCAVVLSLAPSHIE